MRCLCTFPSSLHHFHLMVPVMMFDLCRMPPKPLIVLSECCSVPTKSLISCEIHAVHQLSMPIGLESMSKLTDCWPYLICCRVDIAMMVVAIVITLRLLQGMLCFLAIAILDLCFLRLSKVALLLFIELSTKAPIDSPILKILFFTHWSLFHRL